MNIEELSKRVDIPEFNDSVENKDFLKTVESPSTLQVNVGRMGGI